jgi:ribosomal protein S27AE
VWAIARLTDGPRVVVDDDAPGHAGADGGCLHLAGRCVTVSDTDALAFCRAAAAALKPRLEAFLEQNLTLADWESAIVDLQQVVALIEGAPFCTLCGDAVAVDTARGLCGPCAYDLWRDQEGR